MESENYMGFLILAEQYLRTSQSIIDELIKNDNTNFVISDKKVTIKELTESTKWSDFNTSVPTFLLLYHGFELLIKGILLFQKQEIVSSHSQINQIGRIIENEYTTTVISILKNYISPQNKQSALYKFLNDNAFINEPNKRGKMIDNPYYFLLRYPNFDNGKTNYTSLRYNGKNYLSQMKVISRDIDKIMKVTIKMVRREKIPSR